MIDIKSEVKLAFTQNKIAILTSTAIFFVSLILGFLLTSSLNSIFDPIVQDLTNKVETGVVQLTFQDIFLNNIRIVFRMFCTGLIFCLSAVILSFNGFFVGYFMGRYDDLFRVLLLTVPHGIFEFPSCILATAAGFVLFVYVCKVFKSLITQKDVSLTDRIYNSFIDNIDKIKHALILFVISMILMVIAGIIEVYVTIPFSKFVLSIFG